MRALRTDRKKWELFKMRRPCVRRTNLVSRWVKVERNKSISYGLETSADETSMISEWWSDRRRRRHAINSWDDNKLGIVFSLAVSDEESDYSLRNWFNVAFVVCNLIESGIAKHSSASKHFPRRQRDVLSHTSRRIAWRKEIFRGRWRSRNSRIN